MKTHFNQISFVATKTVPEHLRAQLIEDASELGIEPIDVLLLCYANNMDQRGVAPEVKDDGSCL